MRQYRNICLQHMQLKGVLILIVLLLGIMLAYVIIWNLKFLKVFVLENSVINYEAEQIAQSCNISTFLQLDHRPECYLLRASHLLIHGTDGRAMLHNFS
jgi:hypothetical protein